MVDILAIALLWLVWHAVGEINQAIGRKAETIEFYGRIFLLLTVLIVPILHIIGTIEFLKPGTLEKNIIKGIDINWFLVIVLGFLIALSFFVKQYFITHIEDSGYVYCPDQSRRTSFSMIYVFVRSDSGCNSIGLE